MPDTLLPIEDARGRKLFVDVPGMLLRDFKAFVPPLRSDALGRIDPSKNPFFLHAETRFWVCMREGEPVGRISATVDQLSLDFHEDKTGYFGHYLAQDEEAGHQLLGVASEFLRAKGMTRVRGPVDLSTNYTCGLQVSHFDHPPMIDMNQHPEGQEAHLLSFGLAKARDLLAIRLDVATGSTARLDRVAKISAKRLPCEIREMRLDRMEEELKILHDLYVRAWEKNFAFVPMSKEEFFHAAKDFKKVLKPGFALIAERDGEALGFIVTLPDINPALIKNKGRLFPFGFLPLLKEIKRPVGCRIFTLGLVPEARNKGLDARLISVVSDHIRAVGTITTVEVSWILEDNQALLGAVESIGLKHEPIRYRLYEMGLERT